MLVKKKIKLIKKKIKHSEIGSHIHEHFIYIRHDFENWWGHNIVWGNNIIWISKYKNWSSKHLIK